MAVVASQFFDVMMCDVRICLKSGYGVSLPAMCDCAYTCMCVCVCATTARSLHSVHAFNPKALFCSEK